MVTIKRLRLTETTLHFIITDGLVNKSLEINVVTTRALSVTWCNTKKLA